MELLERFEEATVTQRGRGESVDLSRNTGIGESRTHCAYNQTRECFLGLEVKAADMSPMGIGEWIAAHPLKSGEGLWMTPFQSIPSTVGAPLDLIYLDRDCSVIATIESFPTFQASASTPQPDSVLALPAHSIYSSQTQVGDQLVLCVAEEMGAELQRLNGARNNAAHPINPRNRMRSEAAAVTGAVLLRDKPLWSDGPGVLELEGRQEYENAAAQSTYEMELAQPDAKSFGELRSWFKRWWSPDPRKAPRVPASGLAAYFWNGSTPVPHGVRDISSTGLYVVTEERWYPGTLVVMILQRSDRGEEIAERSIRVQSRAVRWGPDGVGLQFLLEDDMDPRLGQNSARDAVCRSEFEKFLEQLKLDNGFAG